mmetsp:Transcript_32082/g.49058  ORF Transcript_32082/g.49058 Transcript_32082/m.49058 type:complete len:163 (-) Transcript_32082:1038-1526(-)
MGATWRSAEATTIKKEQSSKKESMRKVIKASGSKNGSFDFSNHERKIKIYEETVLGRGSGGTCVFEGKLNGRVVAVKRMLHYNLQVAKQEIEFLQKVDLHPNLLTYFHEEKDDNFIYLAVEKCEGDLEHFIYLMKQPAAFWDNPQMPPQFRGQALISLFEGK